MALGNPWQSTTKTIISTPRLTTTTIHMLVSAASQYSQSIQDRRQSFHFLIPVHSAFEFQLYTQSSSPAFLFIINISTRQPVLPINHISARPQMRQCTGEGRHFPRRSLKPLVVSEDFAFGFRRSFMFLVAHKRFPIRCTTEPVYTQSCNSSMSISRDVFLCTSRSCTLM